MISVAPYGAWKSRISASLLTESAIGLRDVAVDGEDIYWSEGRPSEGGRTVIVRSHGSGAVADAVPNGFNARSRVHEYGGGFYAVREGVVLACRFEDQRVYRIEGAAAVPVTPEPAIPAGDRYADLEFHGDRVICVRERHLDDIEAVTSLVTFPIDGSSDPVVISEGNDFYSTPRASPDGRQLAWLSWNHPNMPWDGTELWCAALAEDGTVSESELVAGGEDESIFQPEWSPDGVLHFVSDRSGWWNIYRLAGGSTDSVHPMDVEFGVPQWVFGMRRYCFLPDGRVVAMFVDRGVDQIGVIDDEMITVIPTPYTSFRVWLATYGNSACVVAGSPSEALEVVTIDAHTGDRGVLRTSLDRVPSPESMSHPKPIEYPTTDNATAHAFYYPPHNPAFEAPGGERPPLLVLSHGGPTSATDAVLDLAVQFWTSRGFAVVDVNYRGSTGYGREYRNALRGRWGVVDLDDCINAALYLVDEGLADPDRLAIRGGSAGGYTTLCALTFSDVFSAGASYFGVGDLAALAEDTHKFESRYLDRLVGPYPEAADLYAERSPVNHLEDFDCPVVLFQGLDDRVVPPEQAEDMVEALDARGVPHAYVSYEGEGHGFRRAENIKGSLEAELYFYGKVFGFDPADDLPAISIAHEAAL